MNEVLLALKLGFYRLSFFWQGLRYRRSGGSISIVRDGSLVGVEDRDHRLMLPTLRRFVRYRGGITWRINKLAKRYGCPDFYEPQSGDTIVDIGSNVGEFSLYAVSRGARAYAFEPDPTVYECLSYNLGRLPNAHSLKLALWNEQTTLRFSSAPDKADSSFFNPDSHVRDVLELETSRLDDVAEIRDLETIDFIKIDGEGAEPEILEGAANTLRRTRRIAIDVGPERDGKSTRDAVIEILEAAEFTIVAHDSECELLARNGRL
ncbi:MAG: FkbM family methyltransferase [Gammaproteobacteria bacterium]|nr:FkbM family methyltransferase [Gammaproteobacteria bacterium]